MLGLIGLHVDMTYEVRSACVYSESAEEKQRERDGDEVRQSRTGHFCISYSLFYWAVWVIWDAGTVYCFNEGRSEEHTSELQSLMRISYAVFCLKKKNYQL